MPYPELLNRFRRRGLQTLDQLGVRLYRPWTTATGVAPWDGAPRIAVLTVNFHTTRWLKAMLLSLGEQDDAHALTDLVIVDNGSRDGGMPFLRALEQAHGKIHVLENARRQHHAGGMRAGLTLLETLDASRNPEERANICLFCDPDLLLLAKDVIERVAECFGDPAHSHAGELRTHLKPIPEAQASFLAVRRDWMARPGVNPWVNHGSPAWWMQRDITRLGGKAVNLPVYSSGAVLHRGRGAVAATRRYDPRHPYATARRHAPHFMGQAEGQATWDQWTNDRADLLAPGTEHELVELVASALGP